VYYQLVECLTGIISDEVKEFDLGPSMEQMPADEFIMAVLLRENHLIYVE
jgi:hypothetical protein